MDGQIKFTEQGEVITYRYGNAQTAAYELTVSYSSLVTLDNCQGMYFLFDVGVHNYNCEFCRLPKRFSRHYIQNTDHDTACFHHGHFVP